MGLWRWRRTGRQLSSWLLLSSLCWASLWLSSIELTTGASANFARRAGYQNVGRPTNRVASGGSGSGSEKYDAHARRHPLPKGDLWEIDAQFTAAKELLRSRRFLESDAALTRSIDLLAELQATQREVVADACQESALSQQVAGADSSRAEEEEEEEEEELPNSVEADDVTLTHDNDDDDDDKCGSLAKHNAQKKNNRTRRTLVSRELKARALRSQIRKTIGQFRDAAADVNKLARLDPAKKTLLRPLKRNLTAWSKQLDEARAAYRARNLRLCISLCSKLLHLSVAVESAELRLLRAQAFLLAGEYQSARADTAWVLARRGVTATREQALSAALTLARALVFVLGNLDAAEANLQWCVSQQQQPRQRQRQQQQQARVGKDSAVDNEDAGIVACLQLLERVRSVQRKQRRSKSQARAALLDSIAERSDFVRISDRYSRAKGSNWVDKDARLLYEAFSALRSYLSHLKRLLQHIRSHGQDDDDDNDDDGGSASSGGGRGDSVPIRLFAMQDALSARFDACQVQYQLLVRTLAHYDHHRQALQQFYEPSSGGPGGGPPAGGPAEGEIFALLDSDRDGWISEDEFFAEWHVDKMSGGGGAAAQTDLAEVFRTEDRDRSGNISWHEFSGPKGRGPPPTEGGSEHQAHAVAPDGTGAVGFLLFNNSAWSVHFPHHWPESWLQAAGVTTPVVRASSDEDSYYSDTDEDEDEDVSTPSQQDYLLVLLESLANNTARACTASLESLDRSGAAAGNRESLDSSLQRFEIHIMRATGYAFSASKGLAWAASEQRRVAELVEQFEEILLPHSRAGTVLESALTIGLGGNSTRSTLPKDITAYLSSRVAFLERTIFMSPEAERLRNAEQRRKDEEEARRKESEEAARKYADDLYERLEVPRNASQADIKRAYRKQALKWHPDKHPNATEEAAAMFMKVSEAMDVLGNQTLRELYDQGQRNFDQQRASGFGPDDGDGPHRNSRAGAAGDGSRQRGSSRPGNQQPPGGSSSGGRGRREESTSSKSGAGDTFWDDVDDREWQALMRQYIFDQYPADYIQGGWQLVWRLNVDGSRERVFIDVDAIFHRLRSTEPGNSAKAMNDKQPSRHDADRGDLDDTVCGRGHFCLGRKSVPPPPEPDALHVDLDLSNPVSASLVLTAQFEDVCNENNSHSGNDCLQRKGRRQRRQRRSRNLKGDATDSSEAHRSDYVTHVFVFHGRPGSKSSRLLFNGSIFTTSVRDFEKNDLVSPPAVNRTARAPNDANTTSHGISKIFNASSAGSASFTNESDGRTSPQKNASVGRGIARDTSTFDRAGTFKGGDVQDAIADDRDSASVLMNASLMLNTTIQSAEGTKPNATTVLDQESSPQHVVGSINASENLRPPFNSSSNATDLPSTGGGFQVSMNNKTVKVVSNNATEQKHPSSQVPMTSSDTATRVATPPASPTSTASTSPGNFTGAWSQIIRNARLPTSSLPHREPDAGTTDSSSNVSQGGVNVSVNVGGRAEQDNGVAHEVPPMNVTPGDNQSTPLPSESTIAAASCANDTEESTAPAHVRHGTPVSNVDARAPQRVHGCSCDCAKPVTSRGGSRSDSDNDTDSYPGDSAAGHSSDRVSEINELDELEVSRALEAARRSLRIAEGNLRDAQAYRDAQAAHVADLEVKVLEKLARQRIAQKAENERQARLKLLRKLEDVANTQRNQYLAHMGNMQHVGRPSPVSNAQVPDCVASNCPIETATTVSSTDQNTLVDAHDEDEDIIDLDALDNSEVLDDDVQDDDSTDSDDDGGNANDKSQFAFTVGQQVQARWKRKRRWYLAQVVALDETAGSYTLEYFDGDLEEGVLEEFIVADESDLGPSSLRAQSTTSSAPVRRTVANNMACARNQSFGVGARVKARWLDTQSWFVGTITDVAHAGPNGTSVAEILDAVAAGSSKNSTPSREAKHSLELTADTSAARSTSSIVGFSATIVFDDGDVQDVLDMADLQPLCNASGHLYKAETLPVPGGRSSSSSVHGADSDHASGSTAEGAVLQVGTSVQAQWKGFTTWYPASIAAVESAVPQECSVSTDDENDAVIPARSADNHTGNTPRQCRPSEVLYSVKYHDGDFEARLPARRVREVHKLPDVARTSLLKGQTTAGHNESNSAAAAAAVTFVVGQAVQALWKGAPSKYYPATVVAFNNGTDLLYLVYDDGDLDTQVPVAHVRPLPQMWDRLRASADDDASGSDFSGDRPGHGIQGKGRDRTFQVGEHVYAMWRRRSRWFSATIARQNDRGCYDLLYDDGDAEDDVCAEYIMSQQEFAMEKGGITSYVHLSTSLSDAERAALAARVADVTASLGTSPHQQVSQTENVPHRWTMLPSIGDRVSGNWKGFGGWYDAQVTAVLVARVPDGGVPRSAAANAAAALAKAKSTGDVLQFTVDLLYDDGDVEVNISQDRVRPPRRALTSSLDNTLPGATEYSPSVPTVVDPLGRAAKKRTGRSSAYSATEEPRVGQGDGDDDDNDENENDEDELDGVDDGAEAKGALVFAEGDRVRGNWRGLGNWYRAKVLHVHVTTVQVSVETPRLTTPDSAPPTEPEHQSVVSYDLRYFDGDVEMGIPAGRVRVDEYAIQRRSGTSRASLAKATPQRLASNAADAQPAAGPDLHSRKLKRDAWRRRLRKQQQRQTRLQPHSSAEANDRSTEATRPRRRQGHSLNVEQLPSLRAFEGIGVGAPALDPSLQRPVNESPAFASRNSTTSSGRKGKSHEQIRTLLDTNIGTTSSWASKNAAKLSYRKVYTNAEAAAFWAYLRKLLWPQSPSPAPRFDDVSSNLDRDTTALPTSGFQLSNSSSVQVVLQGLEPGATYEDVFLVLCSSPYEIPSFAQMLGPECRTLEVQDAASSAIELGGRPSSMKIPVRGVSGAVNDGTLDGGGWLLVRHAAPLAANHPSYGQERWHAPSDLLSGLVAYGPQDPPNAVQSPHSFSLPFGNWRFSEFLFSSGDGQRWVIVRRDILQASIGQLANSLAVAMSVTVQDMQAGTSQVPNAPILHQHQEIMCLSSSKLEAPHPIALEMQARHSVSENATKYRVLIRDIDPTQPGSALVASDVDGDHNSDDASSDGDSAAGAGAAAAGRRGNHVRTHDPDALTFSSHSSSWLGDDRTVACESFVYADSGTVGDDGIGECISTMRVNRRDVGAKRHHDRAQVDRASGDVLRWGANVWVRSGDSRTGYSNPLEGMCRPQTAQPTTADGDPTGLSCIPRVWSPESDADWMTQPASTGMSSLNLPRRQRATTASSQSSNELPSRGQHGSSAASDDWYRVSMSLPLANPMSFVRALPGLMYSSKSLENDDDVSVVPHSSCTQEISQHPLNGTRAETSRLSRFSRSSVPEDDEEAVYRYCCRGGYWSPAWGRASERSRIYQSCTDFDHYASIYLHHGKRNGASTPASTTSTTESGAAQPDASTTLASSTGIFLDANHNLTSTQCLIRIEGVPDGVNGGAAGERAAPPSLGASGATTGASVDAGVYTAYELCPYLLLKRLSVDTVSGDILASEYLGSFKSESHIDTSAQLADTTESSQHQRSSGMSKMLIHSYVHPESGSKAVVEFLCDNNSNSTGASQQSATTAGSADEFTVVLQTEYLLHLRIVHHLGCD